MAENTKNTNQRALYVDKDALKLYAGINPAECELDHDFIYLKTELFGPDGKGYMRLDRERPFSAPSELYMPSELFSDYGQMICKSWSPYFTGLDKSVICVRFGTMQNPRKGAAVLHLQPSTEAQEAVIGITYQVSESVELRKDKKQQFMEDCCIRKGWTRNSVGPTEDCLTDLWLVDAKSLDAKFRKKIQEVEWHQREESAQQWRKFDLVKRYFRAIIEERFSEETLKDFFLKAEFGDDYVSLMPSDDYRQSFFSQSGFSCLGRFWYDSRGLSLLTEAFDRMASLRLQFAFLFGS